MTKAGVIAPRRITTAWLRSHGADERLVRRFWKAFGASIDLSGTALRHMGVVGVDLNWVAVQILPDSFLSIYRDHVEAARRTFRRVVDPAAAACDRALDEAAARGELGRAWREAVARREYRAVLAAAMKELVEAEANVIADLLGLPD